MAPLLGNENFDEFVDKFINSSKVVIFSTTTCPYCAKVKELFKSLNQEFSSIELDQIENGSKVREAVKKKVGRSSVPQVFVSGEHLGGCDDAISAQQDGRLKAMLNSPEENEYDFDLLVIGGGSGGLAASKEAAKLGKKVAVFDFVKPTPKGTSWGLGGTCVNVGCIPKKLMHQAALLGHSLQDARKFGWDVPETMKHNWVTMRENIANYIGSLNWGYRVALRENSVQYFNSYVSFVDTHRVKAVDKRGKEKIVSADKFIIATGERPRYPDIPGAREYGITSDDLFYLENCPGKTLVIGASYVALECAGFLSGLGLETSVMVRSIFLRGFDQDMAERVGDYMTKHGVKMLRPRIPLKIEEIEPGRLNVFSKEIENGEIIEEEYNTVLFAIGRDACTTEIGLENVGVLINPKNNKIPAHQEQTNITNIFAIGDVLEGKPELTPVAIEAGLLLARRLYGQSDIQCDYSSIPTTVFTPLEYGAIGFAEDDAIQKYGNENIEVYHSSFTPLEWTIAKREENFCYAKLICLIPEKERIVGFHYLGPNAGEVTQGFALGMKLKATKLDMSSTIGIHPTTAEIFTTLSTTKRSGANVLQKGC